MPSERPANRPSRLTGTLMTIAGSVMALFGFLGGVLGACTEAAGGNQGTGYLGMAICIFVAIVGAVISFRGRRITYGLDGW